MNKQDILDEIRRLARLNGDVPLGRVRFERESGISETQMIGVHWAKWSDALIEAGYTPLTFQTAHPDEFILSKLAVLTRKTGRLPTAPVMRLERRLDPEFPSHNTIARLGNKATLIIRLRNFCANHDTYEDIIPLLGLASGTSKSESFSKAGKTLVNGSVYLLRSGKFFKVGCTNDLGRRSYELRIQLPEKGQLIHEIKTDDPDGIEHYWHRRFANKRANGEWFSLTQEDVAIFKRRKFM